MKRLAPRRIFLTLHHEPENDVSVPTSACDAKGVRMRGRSGGVEDYRAMWANVRRRFDAMQVDNVVWAMNYMNYAPWDCLVNDLWPGNDLVDWVTFEAYWSPQYPSWDRTARDAIARDRFPRLEMYLAFDSPGIQGYPHLRVGYGPDGAPDPREQQAFNALAGVDALSSGSSGR